MKKTLFSGLLVFISLKISGQQFDIAIAAKKEFAPSFSFQKTYAIGAKQKLEIGWGIRANAYFSGEKEYLTAPAKLTSGKQSIVAFFTDYKPEKIDTLVIAKSALGSLNAKIVLQYNFTKKSAFGFNIDAIGLSFGGRQAGKFNASNSPSLNHTKQNAKPTVFNLLLVSDSDKGSLNSEIYYKYQLPSQSAIRFGLSFQFLEYTTENVLTYENDRFRHKSLMPFVAYSFKIRK